MKYVKKSRKVILMVPYPAQGHVTPMLQLATAFVSRGFKPVVVLPEFIYRRFAHKNDEDEICFMCIPDGLAEEEPRDFFGIEKAMENSMPIHLESVIRKVVDEEREKSSSDDEEVDQVDDDVIGCMMVDLLASSAIRVGDRCGIQVAGFWPAMLATYRLIAAIPDMILTGLLSQTGNPRHKGPMCIVPGQPMLSIVEDLPWLIGTSAQRNSRFKFWVRTLERSKNLKWLLVNTFPEESHQYKQPNDQLVIDPRSSEDFCPSNIIPVGPLTKQALIRNPISFWEEEMSCLDWLDKQAPCSVLYVSFGSWVSPIGEAKIRSLALALEALERPFIWVLNPSWRQGLPSGYLERISKKKAAALGNVVSWAPQMEVLQHEGVGCYLTHCGWNSTMEAILCKKPLLCYPVAGDQFVNCAYIVKVWQIGVRIRGFGVKDVEQGVGKVMEDGNIRESLVKLNERVLGKETSSSVTANLTTFADEIKKVDHVC